MKQILSICQSTKWNRWMHSLFFEMISIVATLHAKQPQFLIVTINNGCWHSMHRFNNMQWSTATFILECHQCFLLWIASISAKNMFTWCHYHDDNNGNSGDSNGGDDDDEKTTRALPSAAPMTSMQDWMVWHAPGLCIGPLDPRTAWLF